LKESLFFSISPVLIGKLGFGVDVIGSAMRGVVEMDSIMVGARVDRRIEVPKYLSTRLSDGVAKMKGR
jgi:hypothetical protein